MNKLRWGLPFLFAVMFWASALKRMLVGMRFICYVCCVSARQSCPGGPACLFELQAEEAVPP